MSISSKKDYLAAVIAGLLTALFLLPVFKNLGVRIPYEEIIILIGLPLAWIIGIFLGRIIARFIGFAYQFAKFVITGFLNVAIDFGILNILIFTTGYKAGALYALFKAISFIFANTNSYFWNKYWTFHKSKESAGHGQLQDNRAGADSSRAKEATAKEYIQFLVVSVIGLGINVGAASFVVNIIGPQFGISAAGWANIGAAAGSAIGLIWNFTGYKLIVFKA